MAKTGRKPTLDDAKKREIIAILSVGCSRRTAARYVNCDVKTIKNTADRDADFAAQLCRAENQQEFTYLKQLQQAAKKDKYWRAAAWVLERKYPEDYGRRGPDAITVDQIKDLLAQFAEIITDEVPSPEHRQNILKRLQALSKNLKGASKG